MHFHRVSPCDLDLWPSHPQIYTAVEQVIIYQLAKYEKDPIKTTEKSQNADSGKEIKEKRKDNTTTERSSDLVGRP